MKPLRKWLDEQGIKWADVCDYIGTVETHFYIKGKHWIVVFCGYFYNFDRGLLELWTQNANDSKLLGDRLTADDVIELIKKASDNNGFKTIYAKNMEFLPEAQWEKENPAIKAIKR